MSPLEFKKIFFCKDFFFSIGFFFLGTFQKFLLICVSTMFNWNGGQVMGGQVKNANSANLTSDLTPCQSMSLHLPQEHPTAGHVTETAQLGEENLEMATNKPPESTMEKNKQLRRRHSPKKEATNPAEQPYCPLTKDTSQNDTNENDTSENDTSENNTRHAPWKSQPTRQSRRPLMRTIHKRKLKQLIVKQTQKQYRMQPKSTTRAKQANNTKQPKKWWGRVRLWHWRRRRRCGVLWHWVWRRFANFGCPELLNVKKRCKKICREFGVQFYHPLAADLSSAKFVGQGAFKSSFAVQFTTKPRKTKAVQVTAKPQKKVKPGCVWSTRDNSRSHRNCWFCSGTVALHVHPAPEIVATQEAKKDAKMWRCCVKFVSPSVAMDLAKEEICGQVASLLFFEMRLRIEKATGQANVPYQFLRPALHCFPFGRNEGREDWSKLQIGALFTTANDVGTSDWCSIFVLLSQFGHVIDAAKFGDIEHPSGLSNCFGLLSLFLCLHTRAPVIADIQGSPASKSGGKVFLPIPSFTRWKARAEHVIGVQLVSQVVGSCTNAISIVPNWELTLHTRWKKINRRGEGTCIQKGHRSFYSTLFSKQTTHIHAVSSPARNTKSNAMWKNANRPEARKPCQPSKDNSIKKKFTPFLAPALLPGKKKEKKKREHNCSGEKKREHKKRLNVQWKYLVVKDWMCK